MPDRFAAYREPVGGSRLDGLMERACTINEPSMVVDHGLPRRRCSRPASRTGTPVATVNDVFVRPPLARVDAIRANVPGVPVGITLAMSDYQAVDGGESKLDAGSVAAWRTCSSTATTGDDFVGVQTYTRQPVGRSTDGVARPPQEGMPTLVMG